MVAIRLTRCLLDLLHSRIGLTAGPAYASTARGRTEGYRQAMAVMDPAWVVESAFGIESGAEAAEVLMRLWPRPTVLFAVNDNAALRDPSALGKLGLIVSDDIPLVSHLPTPLTFPSTTSPPAHLI